MYPVITISREFGSGGHSIGEKVAAKLGIPFYDGEIVTRVAEESGYAKELIEDQGEYSASANRWFDISSASAMYFQSPQDEIFIAQKRVILDCAAAGPCVIVGRCADYILRDMPNVLSVFIHADKEFCLERSMERNSMTEKEMQKYIDRTNKYRSDFYYYHTGRKWADARNYDLCLNSGKLGFEKCVEEIEAYAKIRLS